jgi:ABC-type transporter Mla MlaB component
MITLEKIGNTLSLAGALTRDEIEEARALLLAALVDCEFASLDLTRIEAIDARGAQLIASFLHTRLENRVEAVSASVDVFLSRIGARSLLGTPT